MRRLVISLFLVVGTLVVPTTAGAAGVPAWSIEAIPYPTNLEPGASGGLGTVGYVVLARNIGGAPTSGTFTIVDRLPAAVKPSATLPPTGSYGHFMGSASQAPELVCNVVGRTVTCTGSTPSIEPGGQAHLQIPIDVEPTAGSRVVVDRASVSGGGASGTAETVQPTTISPEPAPFGFPEGPIGAFGATTDEAGNTVTQAGARPYEQIIAAATFPTIPRPGFGQLLSAGGGVRDVVAKLQPGTVVNPAATSVRCIESQLESISCPDASQVGTIIAAINFANGVGTTQLPLYNMVPPPGYPAELGFEVAEGVYAHLLGRVSSDGSFTLSASANDLVAKVNIAGEIPILWGDPSDASHDAQRGRCKYLTSPEGLCPVERTHVPFVTLPSSCGGPLTTSLEADSWLEPGNFITNEYESTDLRTGEPVGITGCSQLAFEPTIESQATTSVSDSPSGLDFDLHQSQHEAASELSTANLKDVAVTLPPGLVLNPSAGSGLEGCSTSQIGLATAIGASPIRFAETPPTCPNASKIGTVEVTSPLLKDDQAVRQPLVLPGSVYLAKPFDNPFGTLLGIYVVVQDPETGILAKLPGRVEADPITGQLSTVFRESPQLPLSDIRLHLFGGARASLTSPLTCGTHTTTSTLTPWSTPEGLDATPSDSFQTTAGCYASEAAAPKAVSFTAGTASPLSGSYSPFVLRLARPDGSQHITGIDTTLPEGLLGKVAGVPYCPESAIAQAKSREATEKGKEETASPSCPQASEVGTVQVTAGSGSSPIVVSGHAYLAGPYEGAPLSLVVIVPAVAGPFDLGTVVTRVALNVGEYDARIHAVADPLPTVRDGIPLDVRSIELKLDRPSFTLNPTSCEAMQIEGSVSTQAGQAAPLSNRFQVGECGRLAFKPKLAISLKGPTKRTGHPALKAVVTYPKQGEYANIARAQVSLPHSEFLDQGNIGKSCTKPVLAAHACPAKSIYGKAKAWSPLLEKPLEGPVYLVGGYGYKLPAMVAELDGQIRVLLVGKVDTGKNHGIRNTFEAVPDAPVERFVLELKGGKKYGLLENSEDVCKKTQKAGVSFRAQNGKVLDLSTRIANSCKKAKSKKKGKTSGKKPH
jgi:hypothetical protein